MKWLLLVAMSLVAPAAAAGQSSAPANPADPPARSNVQIPATAAAPATAPDPARAAAAAALAAQALATLDTGRLRSARMALESAGAPASSPGLALALARVDLRLGDYARASAAAVEIVDDPELGGRALRLVGIAGLHHAGSAEDGARAYLRGAGRPGAAAAYFGDARPLATPDELAGWRAAPNDSARAAWVTDFWKRRAGRAGVTVADRLKEHFRRLVVADREYRRRAGELPDSLVAPGAFPDEASTLYDDRGRIYIRYGAPDAVETRGEGRIWVYYMRSGPPLRLFFLRNHLSDGSPLLDARAAANTRTALPSSFSTPYDAAIELLQAMADTDPVAAQLMDRLSDARLTFLSPATSPVVCRRRDCPPPPAPDVADRNALALAARDLPVVQAELAAYMRKRVTAALASEDPRPTFERALPFFYDLATFRGEGGRTEVVAALAIPGDQLPANDLPDGRALYTPQVQLALADPATGRVALADSAFQLVAPRRLRSGEFLRLSLPLAAEPARLAVHRVTVRASADSAVGQAYGGATPIPDYAGERLALSDVVLAADEPTGSWVRGQVVLSFMPARHFPASGRVKLFYEIYGLPTGAPYRTEISLEAEKQGVWQPVRGLFGDRPDLTLRFQGLASADGAGTQQEVRIIQPNLRPGRYRIVVRVTNLTTSESASRDRLFELLK